MRRSMLFIPGNTPNLLMNGGVLGADALIFDLEDAVSPDEKDSARILVRNTLKYMDFGRCETIVRINSLDTAYWQKDLEELMPQKPHLMMLPKTGCAEDVLALDRHMAEWERKLGWEQNTVGILPLLETAIGVEHAFEIAGACPRVIGLFLGAEDLTADLRCKRTKAGDEIAYARKRLVMAARAAGKEVYDTPFTDVNDDEGMLSDAACAKSLGFSGKASISPRHVEVINQVFSPTREELDYACEVMDAIRYARERGRGAVALRGKMIDAPIVARAQQTIAAAEELAARQGGRA